MALESLSQENPAEKKDKTALLENAAAKVAAEINQLMEKIFKIKGFVEADGRLDRKKYMERGAISRFRFDEDTRYINKQEKLYSRSDKYVAKKYPPETWSKVGEEELVRAWKEMGREKKGNQMELVAMIMFHKFFSKDFMVVRASTFDDYANGVDMILVNRKTGAVICAFDDVIGEPASDRVDEKNTKMKNKFGRNGTTLKYGFRVTQENRMPTLKEEEIGSLPIFCLQVTPSEFDSLLEAVVSAPKGEPSDEEMNIMEKIIGQLESQCGESRNSNLDPSVRQNLRSADASIAQMRKILKEL